MASDTIARVNYFDRQFLRTQDFVDEQSYQIAMRRRHNIAHHRWGIVNGLQLVSEEQNLFVQPGMAIDVFGRELILEDRQLLPPTAFQDKGSEILNAWLAYGTVSSDQAPKGYAGCGNGTGMSYYRVQEQPQLRLEPPDPAFPDPRDPKGVLAGDISFDASRTPPDDPQRFWPVFLGKITRDLTNKQQPITIDPSGRPYVGLVGGSVIAPSGSAKLQIGSEVATDNNRFALLIRDEKFEFHPKLTIDKDGVTEIQGRTTVHGDVKLTRGAVEFGAGTVTAPQPWRIYRNQSTLGSGSLQTIQNELRIEMAAGTAGSNQVVIGHWSAQDNKFKPCLTIDDQCNVTVHGNLVVEGRIVSSGGVVPGSLSPEARAVVTSALMTGLGSAGVSVQRMDPRSSPPGAAPSAAGPLSDAALQTLTANLHQPDQLQRFVSIVRTAGGSNLVENLRAALHEE
ncbi:MAG TPA: hypothetical protein VNZ53_55590 [Steroidobacteraceae bacterium]|jgi:hypothetical protein|nr:hypothetical protein [Steroidobacteraceae bacterium]